MADEKYDPEDLEEEIADETDEADDQAQDVDGEGNGGSDSTDAASDGDGSDGEADADETSSAEGEGSEERGDESSSSNVIDKMAESEQLEGVSKDEITDALSEVASDVEGEDLAEAVAGLANSDGDDEGDEDAETQEETEDDEVEVQEQEGDPEEESAEEPSESDSDDAEDDGRPDRAGAGEAEEDDLGEEVEPVRRATTAEESALGDIFTPDETDEKPASAYEPDRDDDYGESNTGILMIGGISVLLLAGGLIFLFGFTKQGERLVHLFKGDLKEYELAESKKTQAALREKQRKVIEDTPKIGTLEMRGKPQYSLVKVDGKVQYGKPDGSDYWKRMRLTPKTNFPVFYVEDDHEVTIDAPGHITRDVKLKKGNWTPVSNSVPNLQDAALKYNNRIRVTLVPESRARELELHKRMAKDPENDFYGKVTIESKPEGAEIIFDGSPLKNEDGEKLTTPVTFEKYYVKPEEDDDEENGDESGELEEKKVKVDMPPDKGHKIQLKMPESKGDYPKFVSGLQRQMWTCNWKDGEVPDNPSPDGCNYTFELSVDLDQLKSFIEKRKSTREKIKSAWSDAQNELDSIVEKANRKAGVKRKKKKKKNKNESKESADDETSE